MKYSYKITVILVVLLSVVACADKDKPNYQYMPNMYEPVGYETYEGVSAKIFPEGTEALLPAEHTIPRGYMPYEFENTARGKELARLNPSPLDPKQKEENLATGKQLYTVYCAVCHGDKGNGQGILAKREKILGIPSYNDPARNITVGTTYHAMYYGLNSMGSYAAQFANEKEMWQVSEYVMQLKNDLTK